MHTMYTRKGKIFVMLAVVFASSLLVTSCNSLPKQVFSVAVSPQSASATQMGQNFQFQAVADVGDRNGNAPENVTASAAWSSSSTSIATVQPGGMAKAVGCGTATITANYGGQIGQAQFTSTCTQAPTSKLQSVTVYPSNPTIAEIGETSQFAAIGGYSDGKAVDVSHSVVWSSSSPQIAIISSNGLATAVSCGSTIITAQDGTVVGQTTLTVSCEIPTRIQLIVVKTGSTDADIVSSPAGISCGTQCDALFDYGLGVTLTATPTPKSWTGCNEVLNGNVCLLTVAPGAPANDPTAPQNACSNNPSTCTEVQANY